MKRYYYIYPFLFIAVFLLAAFFRQFNLNWDSGQHLHPDERFLSMVTPSLGWPVSFSQFLDTDASPLNPHNRGYSYFVYGTFPVFFTKFVGSIVGVLTYDSILLIGRSIAGLFDLATTLLIYALAYRLTQRKSAALISMFCYAISILPIQLSHYYTVDPFLNFFIVLSFFLLVLRPRPVISIALGLSFGLAVACKIQALLFGPVILIGLLFNFSRPSRFFRLVIHALLIGIFAFLALRLGQPYLFSGHSFIPTGLNPKLLENWRELDRFYSASTYARGGAVFFPPAAFFIPTLPYVFPLENLLWWGLGLPLGITTLISLIWLSRVSLKSLRRDSSARWILLMLVWILGIFLYDGQLFAKYMRYFLILYPFLAISVGIFLADIFVKPNRLRVVALVVLLFSFLVWPVSFMSVYASPHTRIVASEWIYQHLPRGSVLTSELWDDPLPLCIPHQDCNQFSHSELPLYDPDTPEKWRKISSLLTSADYVVISSNRLYGSLTALPDRYPVAARYYAALFSGQLGFRPVVQFTSRPSLPISSSHHCLTPPLANYGIIDAALRDCPLPGISFVDDYADESFTVYDHPKVIIFQKTTSVDYLAILHP
jgi:hypothetical protein